MAVGGGVTFGWLALVPFIVAVIYIASVKKLRGLWTIFALWAVGMLLFAAFAWFAHAYTADALSKGCPGGDCSGFPATAWDGTRDILSIWLLANAAVGALILLVSRLDCATSASSQLVLPARGSWRCRGAPEAVTRPGLGMTSSARAGTRA
jgi:hypothetical protein